MLFWSHSLSMRCASLSWLMAHILTILFKLSFIITTIWCRIKWYFVLSCMIMKTASGVTLDWFTCFKFNSCIMWFDLLTHWLSSYNSAHYSSFGLIHWNILRLRLYLSTAMRYNLCWLSFLLFQLVLCLNSFLLDKGMAMCMQWYLRVCSIMAAWWWLFYFLTLMLVSSWVL